jgi:hypothetical protein
LNAGKRWPASAASAPVQPDHVAAAAKQPAAVTQRLSMPPGSDYQPQALVEQAIAQSADRPGRRRGQLEEGRAAKRKRRPRQLRRQRRAGARSLTHEWQTVPEGVVLPAG